MFFRGKLMFVWYPLYALSVAKPIIIVLPGDVC